MDEPKKKPPDNLFNLDVHRGGREPLTFDELRRVRLILAEYDKLRAESEALKTCCPVARNILRLPSD